MKLFHKIVLLVTIIIGISCTVWALKLRSINSDTFRSLINKDFQINLLTEENKNLNEVINSLSKTIQENATKKTEAVIPFPTKPTCLMPERFDVSLAKDKYFMAELSACDAQWEQYEKDVNTWRESNL